MIQQQPILIVAYLYFTFSTKIQALSLLTSDLLCLNECVAHPKCRGYRLPMNKPIDNCELVLNFKQYAYSLDPIWVIANEIEQPPRLRIVGSREIIWSGMTMQAASAGFDVQLDLPHEVLFLKLVTASMNIQNAQYECLRHGGVLPLEDSDDFIEGMSSLLGDFDSTRFTSLVREAGQDPNQPHLVWQTGRVEATVVDGSNPKYTSWNQRFFMVNPATKAYMSVAGSTTKSSFYCQYLGPNLALKKATYPSSTFSALFPGSAAVDGVIDKTMWHANTSLPMKNHWFAVDLGGKFLVNHLLFITRLSSYGERSRFMKVWIGDVVPPAEQDLDNTMYKLCGEYPYIHGDGYLSGISCVTRIIGSVVILENGYQTGVNTVLQLTELLIF